MRSRHRLLLLVLPVLASGCTAVESVNNQEFTYRNSWVLVAGMFAFGVVNLVGGVGVMREAIAARSASVRRRKKSSKRTGGGVGKLIAGVIATGLGLLFTLLLAPSALLASITVTPQKAVFRDSILWFTGSAREYPYETISSLQVVEVDQLARRGRRKKQFLMVGRPGGAERIEMNAIHRAAFPRMEAAWRVVRDEQNRQLAAAGGAPAAAPPALSSDAAELFNVLRGEDSGHDSSSAEAAAPGARGDAGASPAGTDGPASVPATANGAAAIPPTAPRDAPLAQGGGLPEEFANRPQATHRGRYRPGGSVHIERDGASREMRIVAVFQSGELLVASPDDPSQPPVLLPMGEAFLGASTRFPDEGEGPGAPLADADIQDGARMAGCYDGLWFPVILRQADGPSHVVVEWEGEPGRHSIPRSWVRVVQEPELIALVQFQASSGWRTGMGQFPTAAPTPEAQALQQATRARRQAQSPRTPGAEVTDDSELEVGDILLKESGSRWLPVEIVLLHPSGDVRIHWVGWGDNWDEDAPRSQLRYPADDEPPSP